MGDTINISLNGDARDAYSHYPIQGPAPYDPPRLIEEFLTNEHSREQLPPAFSPAVQTYNTELNARAGVSSLGVFSTHQPSTS